jgi:hypothetical protein
MVTSTFMTSTIKGKRALIGKRARRTQNMSVPICEPKQDKHQRRNRQTE